VAHQIQPRPTAHAADTAKLWREYRAHVYVGAAALPTTQAAFGRRPHHESSPGAEVARPVQRAGPR